MLGQQIVNGVVVGLVYAILALGFSLAYATTRVVNFAHGELFTLGAFVGLTFQTSLSLAFPVAAAASTLVVGVLAGLFSYLVLGRLGGTLERSVATVTVSLGLRDGMLVAFGSDSATFPPVFPAGAVSVDGLMLPRSSLVIAAFTAALLVIFWAAVEHTRWGVHTRATAQNEELAATAGIHTKRVQASAFAVSAGLAAAAGLLVGPTWQVHYAAGAMIGAKAFTAALLGGLGRLSGAVVGGVLLGVVEALLVGYLSSAWKDVAVYSALITILVLMPRGVIAARSRRLG